MTHPDPDSLMALALDTLPEEKREALLAHIKGCPSCRQAYRSHLEVLAHLAQNLDPVPVPEEWEVELRRHLRTGSLSPSPALSRRRVLALALGALALGFLALWGYGKYQDILAWRRFLALASRPGGQLMPLVDPAGQQTGWVLRTAEGKVVLYLKRPPPRGRVYQAWLIRQEGRESLGTSPGRWLEIAAPLPPGSWLGVSVEPPGGSPAPTTPSVGRAQL